MGNPSLDLVLNNSRVDKGLYERARNFVSYAALYSALACGNSGGVDGPKPPVPGKPSASISASPSSGMSPLEATISPSGSPGNLNSIRKVWVDYNADNSEQPDEIFTSVPPQTSKMFYHDGSNNPINQKIIRLVLTNDKGESARDSSFINVMKQPAENQYQVSLTDIVTGQPIVGNSTINGISVTTGADGKGILKTTQQIGSSDPITITVQGNATRTTYSAYSSEQGKLSYTLIPSQYANQINQIVRTGINGQNFGTRKWDTSITPRFIINTTNLNPEIISMIEDVFRNDVELLTDGKVKNAANIEYVTSDPADLTGKIVYSFTTGAPGLWSSIISPADLLYKGGLISTKNTVNRAFTVHELAHLLGHIGHYSTVNGSIMDAQMSVSRPSAIDILNGKLIYSRPTGSMAPDSDPLPTSISNIMQSNMNAARMLKANNPINYRHSKNYNRR